MKQTFKKYIAQLTFLAAGIFIATGLSIAGAAGDWKAPTANPPGDNVDAPINVGPANQIKIGALTMGGAVINGGLILRNGQQAERRILVSDADGLASWKDFDDFFPENNQPRTIRYWIGLDQDFDCPAGSYVSGISNQSIEGSDRYVRVSHVRCTELPYTFQ
jgi:hypothetical protein